ncbi:transglycosylase domain-containing protein [Pseudoroseomonas wenyumeiae]
MRLRLPGLLRHRWLKRLGLAFLLGPPLLILFFRFVPVPVTPLMLLRAAQGYGLSKDWVPYEQIALPGAQRHRLGRQSLLPPVAGLRLPAVARAGGGGAGGDRPRGASTITMQVAKNLFLWPGRDPLRKVLEAWLTPQVALLWPRQRVLEVYLNIVEFGPGIYGAEAAAQAFFNRPAARLTAAQAARLAVVLPNPLEWSAASPGPYVQNRADLIRRRAGQLGELLDCAG